MKTKRIVNRELISLVKTLPCVACGRNPGGDAHHVTTVAAGGDDVAENLMPLCRTDHQEWHRRGPSHMIRTYGGVKTWLELAGRKDVFRRAALFDAGCPVDTEADRRPLIGLCLDPEPAIA
jgi:hypothetical protein